MLAGMRSGMLLLSLYSNAIIEPPKIENASNGAMPFLGMENIFVLGHRSGDALQLKRTLACAHPSGRTALGLQ